MVQLVKNGVFLPAALQQPLAQLCHQVLHGAVLQHRRHLPYPHTPVSEILHRESGPFKIFRVGKGGLVLLVGKHYRLRRQQYLPFHRAALVLLFQAVEQDPLVGGMFIDQQQFLAVLRQQIGRKSLPDQSVFLFRRR